MLAGKLQNSYFGAEYVVQRTKAVPEIDPSDATYDEMMQFYQNLLEDGKIEEGAFDFFQKPKDSDERSNYLAEAEEKKKAFRDSGEMEGYRNALQAYQAMCNHTFEPKYVETEQGIKKAEYRAGELTSGILGLGVCGNALYSLRYAQNSTLENPIVEVRVENHLGTGKETYFVDIHSVDTENAAEMELLALLAHYEKQGMTFGTERLYEKGRAEGIFSAENLREFLYEKKNWKEQLEEFSGSEISLILQELMQTDRNL